jgi:prepilin-type processing-associated H-X9-DG protein
VASAFDDSGLPALMTVFQNRGRWDRSNVVFADGRVVLYEKDRTERPSDMTYIDYGLSILRREVVERLVPHGVPSDLAPLYTSLSKAGELAGFEATDRFFEVGSPQGLRDLENHLIGARSATPLSPERP